jgi:hypothetical protein
MIRYKATIRALRSTSDCSAHRSHPLCGWRGERGNQFSPAQPAAPRRGLHQAHGTEGPHRGMGGVSTVGLFARTGPAPFSLSLVSVSMWKVVAAPCSKEKARWSKDQRAFVVTRQRSNISPTIPRACRDRLLPAACSYRRIARHRVSAVPFKRSFQRNEHTRS